MAKNTAEILVGPGTLYVADYGEAFPTNAETAVAGNWVDVGYTEDGVSLGYSADYSDIEVAEEFEAVDTRLTGREGSLSAELAQFSLENLRLALGGGTITAVPGPPVENTFTPPTVGNEQAFTLLFRYTNDNGFSSDIQVPKVRSVGTLDSQFGKAPAKATIGVEFKFVKDTGSDLFTIREYVSAT